MCDLIFRQRAATYDNVVALKHIFVSDLNGASGHAARGEFLLQFCGVGIWGALIFRHLPSVAPPYLIVGMMKLESATSPSGQRAVTVFTLVQNFRPSMPCWLVSPKAERFQPPNVW